MEDGGDAYFGHVMKRQRRAVGRRARGLSAAAAGLASQGPREASRRWSARERLAVSAGIMGFVLFHAHVGCSVFIMAIFGGLETQWYFGFGLIF